MKIPALVFALALGAPAALAQAPAKDDKDPANSAPVYTPPQRGAPQRRVGGSSRGIESALPRVILLVGYDRVPKRHVRFSRYNIYARDKLTCQYCGRRLPRYELNLDHVIPRSRGGMSTWENVVCSCHECNRHKGGRTPQEAGMALLHKPYKPKWTPFMQETFNLSRYREWLPFLNAVDLSYWNTELQA